MKISTKYFGDVEFEKEQMILFPKGIPAFENEKSFLILDDNEPESPFRWLQSVNSPSLVFAILNPFLIKQDYDFEISDHILKEIEVEEPSDMDIYSVVVIPDDFKKMSMNLKAPIIINPKTRQGIQVILDTDKYGVRHYILDDLKTREVHTDVGAIEKERSVNCTKR